jgi:hypothetical protein
MQRLRNVLSVVAALAAIAFFTGGGCGGSDSGQHRESGTQQSNYNRLVGQQPAHTMDYSPTRDTINFWIDTWGKKPGKPSYVYLQAQDGKLLGYYVLKGLPVSYCASITPTYTFTHRDLGDAHGDVQVPAPSIDAVYYSGGGGLCSTYYGRDLTTNSYLEYTVGQGQNVLLYERPLPRQDVQPLGPTTIKDAQHK